MFGHLGHWVDSLQVGVGEFYCVRKAGEGSENDMKRWHWGIDQMKTTPYRPESNGLIERMHKSLGSIVRKCASEGKDWV